ncbi:hypothetical protein PSACC_03157 [Paramicrosporidium saccamoebae]|uniref:Ubiquitin carboxyl-terminal hydrolase n=1 Tax=Paramicrosporidium saccamoebae TaxID=1246581 RepID=A0A2H9TGX5_9FUNG|nr:hypothetical protein PSACC_03157 [Paramicrosporidium saccamoebae]
MNSFVHVMSSCESTWQAGSTLDLFQSDDESGLDVCLSCFNGGCTGRNTPNHSQRHYRKTSHALVMNLKRRVKSGRDADQQPSKLQKLEIVPEREPEYDWSCTVRCVACSTEWEKDSEEIAAAEAVVKAIISSISAQKKINVQAWQEEAVPCDHTKSLTQETGLVTKLGIRDQCSECDMKDNLWICLTCGSIGCGRKQYDGTGGNGHGASHFDATRHPVAVKLGTISPEGSADVHCYICSEMRVDPKLSEHLSTFGIDLAGMEKTERTMAELQLEQNMKFDFSMVTDDGKQLEAVHGAGLTGLKNLGNSCYISSSVQSLFLLETFRQKYFDNAVEHFNKCQRDCSSCFVCQASKLSTGLWNGERHVISPWMFKSVTASGHAEFSTARQQDASEFLSYLFKVIQRSDPENAQALVAPFTFGQQQELACASCGDTRFQHSKSTMLSLQLSNVLASSDDNVTVSDQLHLTQFLEKTFSPDSVEAKCSKCGANEKHKCIKMTNAPEYLAMSLSRYVMRNWVPQKIDMSVMVPFTNLDISPFIGVAMDAAVEEEPSVDEAVLMELTGMGFPLAKCKKAIIETGNSGSEAALNWIFEHMDDVVEEESNNSREPVVSQESIQMLIDAGFTKEKATLALKETGGDMERAFDWILSHPDKSEEIANPAGSTETTNSTKSTNYNLVAFISHKGPSVHCGHYIAHVKDTTGRWIMFNDERVVVADPQPPATAAEKAYVYIYQRQK